MYISQKKIDLVIWTVSILFIDRFGYMSSTNTIHRWICFFSSLCISKFLFIFSQYGIEAYHIDIFEFLSRFIYITIEITFECWET